jgi:hypothetical protein
MKPQIRTLQEAIDPINKINVRSFIFAWLNCRHH